MDANKHNKIYTARYYKKHYLLFRFFENLIGSVIVSVFSPGSILDLGCGIGSILEGAFLKGCVDICGIELSLKNISPYVSNCIKPYIVEGDLSKDICLGKKFDCVISFEVAEHIDPEKSSIFINNLTRYTNKYIIMTAAPPGQKGTQHINLKEKNFWIMEIESRHFEYKEEYVNKLIEKLDLSVPTYIKRNLMVFEKIIDDGE